MQSQRQQSSTTIPFPIFMGVAGLTSINIQIRKMGGSFAAASGGFVEPGGAGNGKGWYDWTATALDRNTLGPLYIVATAAGADDFNGYMEIVPYDPFALLNQESVTWKVS